MSKQERIANFDPNGLAKAAYKAILFKTHWPENYAELIETPDYEAAQKGKR